MRVVVCEFRQETNSFNPVVTTREYFEKGGMLEGAEILRAFKPPSSLAGIIHVLEAAEIQIVPSIAMNSQSGGPVDHALLAEFLEKMVRVIRSNSPVDGVVVSLHGATQTTECDDACGYILTALRKELSREGVIAACCDLHANLTDAMMESADIICGYQTYPHSDYYETGCRTARLALRVLRKEPVKMVGVRIPMIAPASGYTTLSGPFRSLMEYAKAKVGVQGLLDVSVFQMQPWLDVAHGGSMALAIAEEVTIAADAAKDLAVHLYNLRNEFKSELKEIDEVLDLAEANHTGRPIILVDSADSTNAGAAGDSAAVVKRLLQRKANIRTAFAISDTNAVEQAYRAGANKCLRVRIGGGKDPGHSVSVEVDARVRSLHDGVFQQEGPAGRGLTINIGRAAVLSVGEIDILVCQNMAGNGDPQLYRAFGIEPTAYQLVVVKACTSFRAAYRALAEQIYEANTPGAACAELTRLDYKNVPKSFYPFTDSAQFAPEEMLYGYKRKQHLDSPGSFQEPDSIIAHSN